MARVTRKKKKRVRQLYGLIFLIFLSAAAGVGLYKLSPSLLDIGRNFRYAAGKFLEQSADTMSAEVVLRGTVFDRNLQEMAVSYRLYSLYVRPSEISDYQEVARIVADVTGHERDQLLAKLNETRSIVVVAEYLEQSQVDLIKNADLQGIYIKPVEERFYPEHETAANLVGFTGKGIGLAGVEGAFDPLLQEGAFRAENLAEIDFKGSNVLGKKKVDVILTIDLEMQKRIDRQLKKFLEKNKASQGVALVIEPKSGAVLSWVSQPTFNPNYYWRHPDLTSGNLLETNIDSDLLLRLRVRIAALLKNGDAGEFLLPEMVAAHDYGIKSADINRFSQLVTSCDAQQNLFPVCGVEKNNSGKTDIFTWSGTAASLVNGGWKVTPYVLSAVYDHDHKQVYERKTLNERGRVLSPSMGIRVRRDLISSSIANQKEMIVHTDRIQKIRPFMGKSKYVSQEGFIGAIPANSPQLLLVIVTQQNSLGPYPRNNKVDNSSIEDFGGKLLGDLLKNAPQNASQRSYAVSSMPVQPDGSNYNQFLISSRIDFQERGVSGSGRVKVMPQLVGLSLRKGLQRINEYDLQVKIQGSGQIVSQMPRPGEPLKGIGECVLTLDSEI